MTTATRSGIFWCSIAALVFVAARPTTTAQTTKTAGASTVATAELKGQVVQVEGNDLVVKLAGGEIRTFRVPPSRRFIIDGKELTVHDLKPGTTLTATTTTTTTPVSVRTKSVKTATVWYAAPPNVILTLPNGENKQYVVKDDVKFTVNGQPATVFDLRKGMKVAVEKIVEEPTVEIAENISVIGHAPAPKADAPAPVSAPKSNAPAAGSPPVSSSVPTATSGVAAGSAPPAGGGGAASSAPAAGGSAAASSAPATGGGAAAGAATSPAAASSAAQTAEAQAESGTSPMLWVGLIIVVGIIAAFFFRSKAKG